MKKILILSALFAWLTSFAPAEAQYRARIDQAWKRIQAQEKQQDPNSKKTELNTSKPRNQDRSIPQRALDPLAR